LTGEKHPSYSGKANLSLRVFTESPYDTRSGGAAVDFRHAAPIIATGLHMDVIQFGYSLSSSPANNALGTAQPLGGSTGAEGLPTSGLNVAITFYSKNYKAYTIAPADAMSGCTGLPCNGQSNLSLYLIDGPGASRTPSSGYPSYFSPKSKAQ
jgi:hypothetical protein